jgi:imidazolonepropionase-like amidohydrolase
MTRFFFTLRARVVPIACAALLLFNSASPNHAQVTATPNGIADNRAGAYAFTNAKLYQSDGSYVNGSLLIRDGQIVSVQSNNQVPAGFFEIDLAGRYIYPGLIDIYTDLGLPELESVDDNGQAENLFPSNQALNANDAIRSNFRASTAYSTDEEGSKEIPRNGVFNRACASRRWHRSRHIRVDNPW